MAADLDSGSEAAQPTPETTPAVPGQANGRPAPGHSHGAESGEYEKPRRSRSLSSADSADAADAGEPRNDEDDEDAHHEGSEAGREGGVSPVCSRASSSRSRAVTVVSLSRRRGLFARLAFVVPEVERPYEYSAKSKWTITAIVALAGSAAPIGSSIFYPALPQMAVELKTTPTITNLTVALYMLSMSIFPLWWSSLSEEVGRRTIYVVSFGLFVVFSILSAVSTNVAMLIVMRMLGGGASASVQAVGAGTIADIWEVRERGRAMGYFYLGPLMGPLLAPILGGALSQRWTWRSTMWFLAIYGGLILAMIVFSLPETLHRPRPSLAAPEANPASSTGPSLSRTSTRRSVSVHTKRAARHLKRFLFDPLKVLAFLRYAPIAITVFWAAITFGALFILNVSLTSEYSKPPYSFSELIIGLLYLPSSLGYILASVVGGRWIDQIMAREARRAGRYDEHGRLIFLPEDRMRENAWLAAASYPLAQIMFGWTIEKGVHWAAPSVACFVFGLGSMLVFGAATTMLTEFMPNRSSGGIAVNNFVRNIFSCVGTIVTQPLINVLGVGWLCTLIGLLALVLSFTSVWSLKRFGPKWRSEMDATMKAQGQT